VPTLCQAQRHQDFLPNGVPWVQTSIATALSAKRQLQLINTFPRLSKDDWRLYAQMIWTVKHCYLNT